MPKTFTTLKGQPRQYAGWPSVFPLVAIAAQSGWLRYQSRTPGKILATGIRNCVDLTVQPKTGEGVYTE
jgi:hypothetical protein